MGRGQFTMTNGSPSKTEDKHRTDQNYFNITYVSHIKYHSRWINPNNERRIF